MFKDIRVNWSLLLQIFWTFFKIGPVTFGGGYAVIPVIEQEVVTRRRWMNMQETGDVLALGQSIPGSVAVNAATIIGYKVARIPGAIAAIIGIILPTFLIVIGLGIAFLQVQDQPKIAAAFKAIKATIVALIAFAGYKIARAAVVDKTTLGTVLTAILIMAAFDLNPLYIIIGGAAAGIVQVRIKDMLGLTVKLEQEHADAAGYIDYYI
ncbi:chromate transporter [Paenibacillus sp. P46E]|uniref:chromate transporter n=1 Tax=Paenibacillus sp. P46E TaxID=1349436 RepID=UPI00093BB5A9|nr:chromate transporter [Paenibacillus sp. P46E]OKP98019.1 chromate transporter [Paenibacillus sp. P46E]